MGVFDIDACIAKLLQKRLLGEALLREICEKTKEVLMRESNVVHISAPVTVVGDIHGSVHPFKLFLRDCAFDGTTSGTRRGEGREGKRGGELAYADLMLLPHPPSSFCSSVLALTVSFTT